MTTFRQIILGWFSRLTTSSRRSTQDYRPTFSDYDVSEQLLIKGTVDTASQSSRPRSATSVGPVSSTDRERLLGGSWRFPERITKDEMFLQMAEVVALRSTCSRLHVGAIITDMEGVTVKAMGYNGNARGLPNRCDSVTPGQCGCIHAELNALIKVGYGESLTLYTTHSPCSGCAKLILNSSVRRVVYRVEYRLAVGCHLLKEHGVELVHLPGESHGAESEV